jgi:hypothetical protein
VCIFGQGDAAAKAAEQARAEEAARQGRIQAGTERVNTVFGQFNDDYYKGVSDAALNYYKPEVDRQYTDARKALTFNLARGGKLQSTAGADAFRKLSDAKARTDVDVANKSQGYATDVKGKVEGQRSDTLNSLYATADPDAAYSSATNAASLASSAPAYTPLNDLFSAFIATGSNAIAAERAGYRGAGTGLFSSASKGSSRVVA